MAIERHNMRRFKTTYNSRPQGIIDRVAPIDKLNNTDKDSSYDENDYEVEHYLLEEDMDNLS